MSTLPHMKRMNSFISIIAELDHLLSQKKFKNLKKIQIHRQPIATLQKYRNNIVKYFQFLIIYNYIYIRKSE